MAAMSSEMLAVSSNQGLLLVDVSRDPEVSSVLRTARTYLGVASDGGRVVAGCGRDGDGGASVDVLDVEGTVLTTLLDSPSLTALKAPATFTGRPEAWLAQLRDTWDSAACCTLTSPSALAVHSDHLWVADSQAPDSGLHRVHLPTHGLRDVPGPLLTPLSRPQDVCVDAAGTLYVATGQQVLARARGGQWREMVSGWPHGEGQCVWSIALTVTTNALIVSWTDGRTTALKQYDFA
jgi:hypothetical protein